MSEKIFEYCGEPGGYIPGLPAVITEREARAEGKLELLQAAVDAGNYRVREAPVPVQKKSMKGE